MLYQQIACLSGYTLMSRLSSAMSRCIYWKHFHPNISNLVVEHICQYNEASHCYGKVQILCSEKSYIFGSDEEVLWMPHLTSEALLLFIFWCFVNGMFCSTSLTSLISWKHRLRSTIWLVSIKHSENVPQDLESRFSTVMKRYERHILKKL